MPKKTDSHVLKTCKTAVLNVMRSKITLVKLLKYGWNYSKEAVDSLIHCLGFVKPFSVCENAEQGIHSDHPKPGPVWKLH